MKLSSLKPGMRVRTQWDFFCLREDQVREIKSDEHGLYIDCFGGNDEYTELGHHYLEGQTDDDPDEVVGLEFVPDDTPITSYIPEPFI